MSVPASKPRLLWYCQHSLGLGHLARSLLLVRRLMHDFSVTLLNGGPMPEFVEPIADLQIVDLPPLRMRAGASSTSTNPVCLHGDVNFKNWMATAAGVALIDLDAISTGPAAADLGGILSGFHYRRVIGRYTRVLAQRLETAFLSGYALVARVPDAAELRWHTAAALLAPRVFRAVTRLRGEALPHLQALLSEAHAQLRG